MISIYTMGMDIFRQSTGEGLIDITHQIAGNVRTTINKEASEGMLITQHPGVQLLVRSVTGVQEQINNSIRDDLIKGIKHKSHASYFIYNHMGNLVLQIGAEIGIPVENRFTLADFDGSTTAIVNDPINSHTDKGFYLPISTPIYRQNSENKSTLIGSMVTYLNIPQLLRNIQIDSSMEAGHFNLLTKSGAFIYDPFIPTGNIPFSAQAINTLSSSDKQWTIAIDEHGIESVLTLVPLTLSHQSRLKYSSSTLLYISFTKPAGIAFINPTRSVLLGAALPGFFMALLLLLIIYIALKKIVSPIDTLKKGAAIIGSGDLDHRISIHTSDEIEDLAKEFNKMTTALKSSYSDLEKKVQERTLELKASNEELEQASSLKSQFLARMSHELRTPLNAIMGFSDVLSEEVYGEINEKQHRYLNNIHSSGKHLLEVINDILDLSKIEAGKMIMHLREVVLADAITEIQSLVTQLSLNAGVNLSFHTEQIPSLIVADCVRFRQIMYNLLSNAIKFTPEGGSVTVIFKQLENDLEVSVKDTGIGISEEHTKAIFKPFRQVDGSSSRGYEGTGLGLALCKEFVEMHGGNISVTSKKGEGSCFTFTIPILDANSVEAD